MSIIELNEENITEFGDIIDPDAAESIGREFYRGVAARAGEDSPSGALIWEYKNLEDDSDTDAEIVFIAAGNKEAAEELLSEFDGQTSGEAVVMPGRALLTMVFRLPPGRAGIFLSAYRIFQDWLQKRRYPQRSWD